MSSSPLLINFHYSLRVRVLMIGVASYSTHFKVAKSSGGEVELAVRSGSLSLYDDFIIDPSQSPTHIPCQTV